MKFSALPVLVLLCLTACNPNPVGLDPRIAELEAEKNKLIKEIQLLEKYGEDFEKAYAGLIDELDRVNVVKDSLYAIKDDVESYDADLFKKLETKLSEAQQTINDLKEKLENSGSTSSIMGVLRMQLDQAEKRITYLEDANNNLAAENSRMKEILAEANESLIAAEDDAEKAKNELDNAKREMKELEAQAQNELDTRLSEEKAAAAAAKKRMLEAAGYYKKAMDGLLDLENYITLRNNGGFKIKKKGLKRVEALAAARRIAREVFDNLSEASRFGHPNSEEKIKRLLFEERYQQIRPGGIDNF